MYYKRSVTDLLNESLFVEKIIVLYELKRNRIRFYWDTHCIRNETLKLRYSFKLDLHPQTHMQCHSSMQRFTDFISLNTIPTSPAQCFNPSQELSNHCQDPENTSHLHFRAEIMGSIKRKDSEKENK